MSLFENIYSFLEGEQAEEYKARKARDKEEAERREKEHFEKRLPKLNIPDEKSIQKMINYTINGDDNGRDERSAKAAGFSNSEIELLKKAKPGVQLTNSEIEKLEKLVSDPRTKEASRLSGYGHMIDAVNRHRRRHANQESGIFESVQFINE